jgi:hypothetical protein
VTFPLDRLGAENLTPLLDELTPAGLDPQVVEEPQAGWESLKKRLSRDLERDATALPVRVLVAIRGLTCLPDQILTVRAYESAGGLNGLEATYVEQCVARYVQGLRTRGLKLEPTQVRAVLFAMVDPNEKEKTIAQPLSVVAAAGRVTTVEEATRLLLDLETRGLVRRRTSLLARDSGGRMASEECAGTG